MSEANRQAAKDFFEEIWNKKMESSINKFIAVDAAGNDPKFGVGRESFRAQWKKWIAAFPDLHFKVEEVIVEGSRVVTRWHLTGTHTGADYLGVKAKGTKIAVDGVSIDTIENGVVLSGFDAWDSLLFRQQLGLIPLDSDS
jgi:predicted ester cyclase